MRVKWWGWGDPSREFDISNRPGLWPFVQKVAGIDQSIEFISNPPLKLEEIVLPKIKRNEPFLSSLRVFLTFSHEERLLHSYGKSFRDLWRIRNGIISSAPDCVCYPKSEEEIVQILRLAHLHDVVIIPFGGGTNIVGCLEVMDVRDRMVLSLDMSQMNRVMEIDHYSKFARVEAGILGPDLESQLNAKGMTLGHFPDSFQYSTLGGWVATRSAGMQSDKYGKIEDMVISLRLITPQGKIVTRTVPKSSNGIDLRHICIGSEGIFGVITEVVIQIHPLPKKRQMRGYLFPSFESGVAALHECVLKGCSPSMTRLNDPMKTALSFAFKSKGSKGKEILGKLFKFYLEKVKRIDFSKACLLLVCFEEDKKGAEAVYKKFGAFSFGSAPGKAFEKGKYDFPYLRDFALDRGIMADVSETSTVWSNLLPLYYKTNKAILDAIEKTNVKPFCSCHISHTYHSGASLYFTFACKQVPGEEMDQYLSIKKAAQDAFMDNGGTLSHHHAVGFEHQPWIEQEISKTGVSALKALKGGLDPKGIMNPGKIIDFSGQSKVTQEVYTQMNSKVGNLPRRRPKFEEGAADA